MTLYISIFYLNARFSLKVFLYIVQGITFATESKEKCRKCIKYIMFSHQLYHNNSEVSAVDENVAMKMEYIRFCRLFSIASIQILYRLRLPETGMKYLQRSHFSISSWNQLRMLS